MVNGPAVFPGGTHGLPSANAGRVTVNANRAAAANNMDFFTVNSLLKWKKHRDNVTADAPVRGSDKLFKVSENVTK